MCIRDRSHVVSVTDVDGRLEDQANIWDELRQVNELAEARNLAMEVFANVNTEAQPAFICLLYTSRCV